MEEKFCPSYLDLIDESQFHKGHKMAGQAGGAHYSVTIVSDWFRGKTLLERHRAVYEALESEIEKDIHALRIKVFSPNEWKNENSFKS